MLLLEHIYKTYYVGDETVHALDDASLHVRPKEFVAICGPSGSGKTTLMNVMGCLDLPDSGRYILDGVNIAECTDKELSLIRSEKIGFVFQQFNLLPSLSALRNVELPLIYAGEGRAKRRDRAMTALSRVGLADRVDHRPGELSGGQQQRVSVARALVTDPALILADEPTGNLDSVSTADVLALFAELHGQGRTIVLITHEAEVAQAAERVVYIRDGLLTEPAGVTS